MTRLGNELEGAPATDSGMSLIELLIYVSLSIVVLTLAGGFLINSLQAEGQTRGLAEASSLGQLVSRSVEEGVRNASVVQAEVQTTEGQLLRARVAVGTEAGNVKWECHAWYYSLETTGFYWATSETGPVVIPADVSALKNAPWLFLGDGIHIAEDTDAFFGANGNQVVLRFEVSSDDVRPYSRGGR